MVEQRPTLSLGYGVLFWRAKISLRLWPVFCGSVRRLRGCQDVRILKRIPVALGFEGFEAASLCFVSTG